MADETIPIPEGKGETGDSELETIHTLRTDAKEFIHEVDTGAIRVAPQSAVPGSLLPVDNDVRKKNRLNAFIAFLILAVALTVGISVIKRAYDDRVKRTELPTVSPNTFIILDATEDVAVGSLEREVTRGITDARGTVTHLRITSGTKVLGTNDFITAIGATPPPDLIDRLDDQFIFVRVGMGEATSSVPAIIFQITSYTHVASGMRRWERELVRSFSGALNLNERNVNDVFEDDEVSNISIRSTYTAEHKPVLSYGIIGQKYLVITKDREALEILFGRLILPQFINE